MARVLGRELARDEIVHHKDGDGLNNDPSNLEVMTQAEHRRLHSGPLKWDFAEGLRLRAEGWSFDKIARHLGVSDGAIIRAMRRRGLGGKRTGGGPKWPVHEAARLVATGETYEQVGRRYGVTGSAIRQTLGKRNLTPPSSAD